MQQQIKQIVADYVRENPLPKLTEEALSNLKGISGEGLKSKEGKEMIQMGQNFGKWYNPLGEKFGEYGKQRNKEDFDFLSDEVDKLLGFKVKRFPLKTKKERIKNVLTNLYKAEKYNSGKQEYFVEDAYEQIVEIIFGKIREELEK